MISYDCDLDRIRFAQAILTRNARQMITYIEKGLNVNISAGGIHVFEALFLSKRAYNLAALDLLFKHSGWNPNYQTVDMLYPEERAMLHKRGDVALRIIQHPNFDRSAYPRVIQSAKRFKSKQVINFLSDQVATR